jgi:hypothetical protein
LRRIVDCEAVDAKVNAYDRTSFRQWRDQARSQEHASVLSRQGTVVHGSVLARS